MIDPPWDIERAQKEASRLFGYKLGCRDNQDAVADALLKIANILTINGDVTIIVRRQRNVNATPKESKKPDIRPRRGCGTARVFNILRADPLKIPKP